MFDLDNLFRYHPATQDQKIRYQLIRSAARDFCEVILANTPESSEQTLAIRRVQEAAMWANCSIALNEPDA